MLDAQGKATILRVIPEQPVVREALRKYFSTCRWKIKAGFQVPAEVAERFTFGK